MYAGNDFFFFCFTEWFLHWAVFQNYTFPWWVMNDIRQADVDYQDSLFFIKVHVPCSWNRARQSNGTQHIMYSFDYVSLYSVAIPCRHCCEQLFLFFTLRDIKFGRSLVLCEFIV